MSEKRSSDTSPPPYTPPGGTFSMTDKKGITTYHHGTKDNDKTSMKKIIAGIVATICLVVLMIVSIYTILVVINLEKVFFYTKPDCDLCDYYRPIWKQLTWTLLFRKGKLPFSCVFAEKVLYKDTDYPSDLPLNNIPSIVYYRKINGLFVPIVYPLKDKSMDLGSFTNMLGL